MAKPNPKTFDLSAALAGRTYPTDTVPVYLDEGMLYDLAKAFQEANSDPASVEKAEAVNDLMKKLKKHAHEIKIRGVDPELVNEVVDELNAKFPLVTDAFGRVTANSERGYEFQRRLWSLYVIEIKDPSGAVIAPPSEEELTLFRNKAPESAITAVDDAIERMRTGAEAAYKSAVKSLPFLSMP